MRFKIIFCDLDASRRGGELVSLDKIGEQSDLDRMIPSTLLVENAVCATIFV